LQWLHDPSELNGDNPNNARRVASRYFRNKKKEYLEDNIIELATSSKNKNITAKLIKVLLHRTQPQFIAFHFLYFSHTTCFGLFTGHLQA
jgi:hypothetical protein